MQPIFVEDSKIPVILTALSPLDNIYAITLFPFVFAKGKIDEETRRHETIHFQQCLETLVIGFYIIYLLDYIRGKIEYGDGGKPTGIRNEIRNRIQ